MIFPLTKVLSESRFNSWLMVAVSAGLFEERGNPPPIDWGDARSPMDALHRHVSDHLGQDARRQFILSFGEGPLVLRQQHWSVSAAH